MYPTSTYVNGVNAIYALDFRGLGLARNLYLAFVDMLYQITNSQFDCSIQTPNNNQDVFFELGYCIAT